MATDARERFEKWARERWRSIDCSVCHDCGPWHYHRAYTQNLFEAYEAGRAAQREEDAPILEALELLHRIALQTPQMNNPDGREVIDQAWRAIREARGTKEAK